MKKLLPSNSKMLSQKSFTLLMVLCVSLVTQFVFGQVAPSPNDTAAPTAAPPASQAAPNASGSTTDSKNKAQPKSKKTTIDFEDQLIEGSRQKPELFYLLQNKDFNYKRLIRLREDFLPELRKSGEDIQSRSGSGQ